MPLSVAVDDCPEAAEETQTRATTADKAKSIAEWRSVRAAKSAPEVERYSREDWKHIETVKHNNIGVNFWAYA